MTMAFPTAVKRAYDALFLFIHHIVHGKSTCPFNPCPVANFLLISKYEEINLRNVICVVNMKQKQSCYLEQFVICEEEEQIVVL
jgi:hypothetical protein